MTQWLSGATATTILADGTLLLATTTNEIAMRTNGQWRACLHDIPYRIRDLHAVGSVIYGVGDHGLFITSLDGGLSWHVERFPTQATLWTVRGTSAGFVVTHGEKVLYVSHNYGRSWKTVDPFATLDDKPSIRSLAVHNGTILFGTKIHRHFGGVWSYHLQTNQLTPLYRDEKRMYSSLAVEGNMLFVASGAGHEKIGKILYADLDELQWNSCENTHDETCFLHIHANDGWVYATASQQANGLSTISLVDREARRVVPIDTVQGHGWRICSAGPNFLVAGLRTSLHYERTLLLH